MKVKELRQNIYISLRLYDILKQEAINRSKGKEKKMSLRDITEETIKEGMKKWKD